jgi:glucose/arabinose dehydrogenase
MRLALGAGGLAVALALLVLATVVPGGAAEPLPAGGRGPAQWADGPALVPSPAIALDTPIAGFVYPVDLTHAGDARLFVVEKGGRIRVVENGVPRPTRSSTSRPGERRQRAGLLGLAFDPNYLTNGFFYVDYTDVAGDTRVVRYKVSDTDPEPGGPEQRLPDSLRRPALSTTTAARSLLARTATCTSRWATAARGRSGQPRPESAPSCSARSAPDVAAHAAHAPAPADRTIRDPDHQPILRRPGRALEIWDWGLRNPGASASTA